MLTAAHMLDVECPGQLPATTQPASEVTGSNRTKLSSRAVALDNVRVTCLGVSELPHHGKVLLEAQSSYSVLPLVTKA